jgi:undecaprenyl diphosphate synthase
VSDAEISFAESQDAVEALAERARRGRVPIHLAIIPDGNRRWAEERGLPPVEGHRAGFEVSKRLSRFCRRIGIHTVTLWAFSTENWKRSREEIEALMSLFEQWLRELLPEAIEEEVRVIHLGRREGVPESMRSHATAAGFDKGLPISLLEAIDEIEEKTSHYDRNVINLAINYGGADEVQRAVQRMLELARMNASDPEKLSVVDFLDTAGQPHPEPDLIWRTSGEQRFSGFLPLQSSYAEFTFTHRHFPDLTEADVVLAVEDFSGRARRFGG